MVLFLYALAIFVAMFVMAGIAFGALHLLLVAAEAVYDYVTNWWWCRQNPEASRRQTVEEYLGL